MLTFTLPPLLYLFLLFSAAATTAAQPYEPTDYFLLVCGSSTATTSNRTWDGDEHSEFVTSDINTTSFSSKPSFQDPSIPRTPYSTARIFNTTSFTYEFPVSEGPKFLRLYFYPATYSDLNANQSFFSVSSNGYSLLTNFSAFLTASYVEMTLSNGGLGGRQNPHLVKEFIIYVKDTRILNVTFTPSPNSYAFINGIEIVSLPESLYFNSEDLKHVGQVTGSVIDDDTALEKIYRLNVGGRQIYVNSDTGMYRSWDQDDDYIYGGMFGLTPINKTPIAYTMETPNYTAPELVYATQRSMGNMSDNYNLTWILPVDSGFYYKLRLHFCNIIPQYTKRGQVVFRIFINNQTAEDEADLFHWTQGSGYAVFKDYVVFVNDPDGRQSKQDLWIAMHPNSRASERHGDGYLNGLEVFKLSIAGNLSSPNPEIGPTTSMPIPVSPIIRNRNAPTYAAIGGGAGGGLVLFLILVLIVLWWRRRVKRFGTAKDTKPPLPPLPSDRCRRFSLTEVKAATGDFYHDRVIGKGGFGQVYKGYIDNGTTTVAIKRLNSSSKQGFHEFQTEIRMLSKTRHGHLVSLIGYCDEDGEMILMYDYMTHGTLREHLYNTNNPHLSWKKRLHICLGAAKGLHYLHTGANRAIIHRDIKSTNILLDENWVAKVSDFGLSKLGPRDQAQNYVPTMVKGTIGYLDPEYYRTEQLTDKSDVYSFGVVLLEVLCARPVISRKLPDEQVNLAEWGKSSYRTGTLHKIIDPKVSGEIAPKCLRKFGGVAHSCLQDKGSERPVMEDVVGGLEFALQLQEAAEKTDSSLGEAMLENQEFPFLMIGEPTTGDESMLMGSTGVALRHGTS
ncbi:receptor-like protein kinase FERONIA [Cynara cardunculus var. scolymus]|uniref:receptor-like protein kinase FERONIA n=1 Tax=Cynara cardunculus var. scolymus TaxID=59895 RepID=UPI000D62D37A|nr:receptor-like protein kinase FERONIA [Cynara cardunculus var. scolymus]